MKTSPHIGLVAALNEACTLAEGRYIARMDADDVAAPERLMRQLDHVERHKIDGICGTRVRMTGSTIGYGRKRYENWINTLVSHEDIVREAFVECPIAHPTFFMSRASFLEAGGYVDCGWPEDYDLFMRMLTINKRFGNVPEPLLEWTESANRFSMTSPRYSPENFRALKRNYLFEMHLSPSRRFFQWGAGEVGKRWLREWPLEHRPEAVVDINPRKVGRKIHSIEVISPEELPKPGVAMTVVAVGAPTARDEIREWFQPRGYEELKDFVFLA
jgi:glycosyltransferase involved in cell wall biosynthesis